VLGSRHDQARNTTPPLPVALVGGGRLESFEIRDAKGQSLAYVYFENERGRRETMKRLTRDEARRIDLLGVKIADWPSSDPA
jgi:hypothetical protein